MLFHRDDITEPPPLPKGSGGGGFVVDAAHAVLILKRERFFDCGFASAQNDTVAANALSS